jgi:hypothetical protein
MVQPEVRLENYALAKAKFEEYSAEHLRPEPLVTGADPIGMGYEPGSQFSQIPGGAGRRTIGGAHREPGRGDGNGAGEVSAGGSLMAPMGSDGERLKATPGRLTARRVAAWPVGRPAARWIRVRKLNKKTETHPDPLRGNASEAFKAIVRSPGWLAVGQATRH